MSRYIRRLSLTPLEGRENPTSSFLAVGADVGGVPLVDVLRADGTAVTRFQPFETSFRGGVRAAAAELDGNTNTVEVVSAAGPGGGPVVTVHRIDLATNTAAEVARFFALDPNFRGGLRVAAGRVLGNTGTDQIVVGADAGGGPHVLTFVLNGSTVTPAAGPLGSFFAFEPGFAGGVRVAAGELDGDPTTGDELVVSAGSTGGPRVKVLRSDGAVLADYFAFRSDFLGGVNVGTENTGGRTDRVRVDGQLADFSQRNAGLNQAAVAAAGVNTTTPAGNTRTSNAGTVNNSGFVNTGLSAANTVNGFNPGFTTGVVGGNTSGGLSTGFFPSAGSTGLSTGFFPTAGSAFGPAGSAIGTSGFGTNGLGSTFGVAGLGTPGFGTGGFNTTGFGNGVFGTGTFGTNTFGTTTGFGVFGDPGVLTPFPVLASLPFVSSPIFGPSLVNTTGVTTVPVATVF